MRTTLSLVIRQGRVIDMLEPVTDGNLTSHAGVTMLMPKGGSHGAEVPT